MKPIQLIVAQHLASGINISDTAKETKISRITIHQWLKDDFDFIAYLNSLKEEQLKSAITRIQSASSTAVKTLVTIMETSKNDMARISAAKEVLSMSGLTKESLNLYGWGIGGTTPEKVKAEKKSEALIAVLSY